MRRPGSDDRARVSSFGLPARPMAMPRHRPCVLHWISMRNSHNITTSRHRCWANMLSKVASSIISVLLLHWRTARPSKAVSTAYFQIPSMLRTLLPCPALARAEMGKTGTLKLIWVSNKALLSATPSTAAGPCNGDFKVVWFQPVQADQQYR